MGKSFLDPDTGLLHKKRPTGKTLTTSLERSSIVIDYFTDEELYAAKGSVMVFDIECYPNFFLIAFKDYYSNKVVTFELFQGKEVFNAQKLLWLVHNVCIIGFNSNKFDLPLLWLSLQNATIDTLHEAVGNIIKNNMQPRDIEQLYGFKMGKTNTVDLIEVAPLSASLKLYMARLHAQRLQDLPYNPEHALSEAEAAHVCQYCINDLDGTALLLKELCPQLELRSSMSDQYGQDLRSKSDAQVAEAVIVSELEKVLGYRPRKPKEKENVVLQYDVPNFIEFTSPELNKILEQIRHAKFALDGLGSPTWPEGLGAKEKGSDAWQLKTKIGKMVYKLGMGGLHSQEKKIAHCATDEIYLRDNDVESFYPRIILNQGLCPSHLGSAFLMVYESIVTRRLEAKAKTAKYKKEGNKEEAKKWKVETDSLKITINGSFGKLGNKYSALYSPQLMLQVTITGQLVLLMLIEMLENAGIEVVSGNTDGIISKYHKSRHEEVRAIIAQWERHTNFKTEETIYKATYSRDVNNYYAIKEEGGDSEARFLDEKLGVKTKGCFSERGSALNSVLSKNPEFLILTDAVQQFIVGSVPIEETIRNCKDVRRFISARTVKGGGEQNGVYLGKVVRFYIAEKHPHTINYVLSGNKVPKSDNAKPCMDLPNEFPDDINYDYYIKEANSILYEIGYLKKSEQNTFF